MDESERLISLAALSGPDRAPAAWREWRATNDIAEASSLLTWAGGYIHRNLVAAGNSDPYLAGIYRHNLLANGQRIVRALPAIRELTARWMITPLKSFGLSADTYSRGLRPLADFDFYVSWVELEQVRQQLRASGLAPLADAGGEEFASRVVPQRGSWNFLGPRGVDLDVHWRLLEHLGTAQSEQLIGQNSSLEASEFGTVRRLNNELAIVVLAAHHEGQPDGRLNGLFDFSALLEHSDPERVALLAEAAGVARAVAAVVATVREIVEDEGTTKLTELEAAIGPVARREPEPEQKITAPFLFERLDSRYLEPRYLRSVRLYRLWWALHRPLWAERLLSRFGGMSRVDDRSLAPAGGGRVGMGWHYLYPGSGTSRWANILDARAHFDVADGVTPSRIRIGLNATFWPISPVRAFGVFVNGRLAGYCDKDDVDFEFDLPVRARSLEVSLRLVDRVRYAHPGSREQWLRLMAPVDRLEVL